MTGHVMAPAFPRSKLTLYFQKYYRNILLITRNNKLRNRIYNGRILVDGCFKFIRKQSIAE